MLFTGVAWTADGYEVEVIDHDGRPALPPARFAAERIGDIAGYLLDVGARLDRPLATVVESTNGVLDGGLMVAGLDVYRADPWHLPARPEFGSVPAAALAEAGRRELGALARLRIDGGTLTGRIDELNASIAASDAAEPALPPDRHCVRHGARDRREVALTFDDGPNPPYTGQILDLLARYEVPATFFCVGLHAGGMPGEVARIGAEGHTVANHTWSHPFLPDLSESQLTEQIDRTVEVLAKPAGAAPTLFRPPYGSRTPQVLGWLAQQEVTTVLWDVEPSDWAMPGADVIARDVLAKTLPGSIILLHDGGGDRSQTVAALPAIIEGLLESAYRFVTVDELVRPI